MIQRKTKLQKTVDEVREFLIEESRREKEEADKAWREHLQRRASRPLATIGNALPSKTRRALWEMAIPVEESK